MYSEPKPWMMTVGIKLTDRPIHLFNLSKYLEIDEWIVGVKFKYGEKVICKGCYNTVSKKKGTLFNNQVSIVLILESMKRVNVKVFKNGQLHMTGINDLKDVLEAKQILIRCINKLYTKTDLICFVLKSGPLIDSDGIVYNSTGVSSIGYIFGSKSSVTSFMINKRECYYDSENCYYITKKRFAKRRKEILSLDGVLIGYQQLVLLGYYKRIYRNKQEITEYDSKVFIGDKCIGVLEYIDLDLKPLKKQKRVHSKKDIIYSKWPLDFKGELVNTSKMQDIEVYSIYLHYRFDCVLEKKFISNLFESKGFMLKRSLTDTVKVDLVYKHSKTSRVKGICDCMNVCTCQNVTFMIFETGKVNVYGLRSLEEAKSIITHVSNIITKSLVK